MRKVLLPLIGFLSINLSAQARDIIISDSSGGDIDVYNARVEQSIRNGDRPVFVGTNVSAATIWSKNPRACAMPGASLVFHGVDALHPVTRQSIAAQHPEILADGTRRYLNMLSPRLRNIAARLVSSHYQFHEIRTPELWNYIPPCNATPATHASQFTGIPVFAAKRKPKKRIYVNAVKKNKVVGKQVSQRPLNCPSHLTFYNNLGGMIRSEFMSQVNLANSCNIPVYIGGQCGSACTYILNAKRVCVMPGTQFIFHASPVLDLSATGGYVPTNHWTMRLLPRHVQSAVLARGGLRHQAFAIPGESLAPVCRT